MAPNQYGPDELNEILEAETRQREQAAVEEALYPRRKPPLPRRPDTRPPAQPAREPDRP
jgi:hypothetical protein